MRLQLILPRVEPTETKQPIYKSHVKRNAQGMIEDLKPRAARDEDDSLSAITVAPQQASADLEWLGEMLEVPLPQDASADILRTSVALCQYEGSPPRLIDEAGHSHFV